MVPLGDLAAMYGDPWPDMSNQDAVHGILGSRVGRGDDDLATVQRPHELCEVELTASVHDLPRVNRQEVCPADLDVLLGEQPVDEVQVNLTSHLRADRARGRALSRHEEGE